MAWQANQKVLSEDELWEASRKCEKSEISPRRVNYEDIDIESDKKDKIPQDDEKLKEKEKLREKIKEEEKLREKLKRERRIKEREKFKPKESPFNTINEIEKEIAIESDKQREFFLEHTRSEQVLCINKPPTISEKFPSKSRSYRESIKSDKGETTNLSVTVSEIDVSVHSSEPVHRSLSDFKPITYTTEPIVVNNLKKIRNNNNTII